MIKGIYTSASAMRAGIARQDITANNLANVNTTGFKRDRLFVKELVEAAKDPGQTNLLESVEASRFTEFTPGAFNPTGGNLDFAIQGRGFFVVEGEDGEVFTRNGHFLRNAEGTLVDSLGRTVMGEGGEISIPEGTVTVGPNGDVSVAGTPIDRLRIAAFENPQLLQKAAGAAFTDPEGEAGLTPVEGAIVRQGFLEGSNVETMKEMVEMIATARNYDLNARMVSTQDQTLQKVVNEIGRV